MFCETVEAESARDQACSCTCRKCCGGSVRLVAACRSALKISVIGGRSSPHVALLADELRILLGLGFCDPVSMHCRRAAGGGGGAAPARGAAGGRAAHRAARAAAGLGGLRPGPHARAPERRRVAAAAAAALPAGAAVQGAIHTLARFKELSAGLQASRSSARAQIYGGCAGCAFIQQHDCRSIWLHVLANKLAY